MSLSFTGWTPSVFHSANQASPIFGRQDPSLSAAGLPGSTGTTPPGSSSLPPLPVSTPPPAATGNTLQNTNGSPNDPRLASRQWSNPLTGNRQVAAAGSVYGNANVPAYLADAVGSLNQEQLQRRIALTGFQNTLLSRLDSAQSAANGTDPYSLINKPTHVPIAGEANSEDYNNYVANSWNNQAQLYNILAASSVQPGSRYSSGWV